MTIIELPYGSWPTPIDSALVVRGATRISDVLADGADVVWSEQRPEEAGRTQLVSLGAHGHTTELLPDDANARTAVHEYGVAAWCVRAGVVWFADWSDQRLYRLERGRRPRPITPLPEQAHGDRYADIDPSPDGEHLVCIREHHPIGGRGASDVRGATRR